MNHMPNMAEHINTRVYGVGENYIYSFGSLIRNNNNYKSILILFVRTLNVRDTLKE